MTGLCIDINANSASITDCEATAMRPALDESRQSLNYPGYQAIRLDDQDAITLLRNRLQKLIDRDFHYRAEIRPVDGIPSSPHDKLMADVLELTSRVNRYITEYSAPTT